MMRLNHAKGQANSKIFLLFMFFLPIDDSVKSFPSLFNRFRKMDNQQKGNILRESELHNCILYFKRELEHSDIVT